MTMQCLQSIVDVKLHIKVNAQGPISQNYVISDKWQSLL